MTIMFRLYVFAALLSVASRGDAQEFSKDQTFRWSSTPPLVTIQQDRLPPSPENPWFAVKDPSVVYHDGQWHLFCTLRKRSGGNGQPPGYIRVGYLSFEDWNKANEATWSLLDLSLDYHGAPQVFYYTPHECWYLVYQCADESRGIKYGPCYSTTKDISDPNSWTKPTPMYAEKPDNLKGWIDFWVICDDQKAHLFFTSNNGTFWRAETSLPDFPKGFGKPVLAYRGDIFEASHTYKVKGADQYITLIESENKTGSRGKRYFKALTATSLDGAWTVLGDGAEQPFAGITNVTVPDNWTDSISHGEFLRTGIDEHLEIDPRNLRCIYQGVLDKQWSEGYGGLSWQLGIIELK